jgi:hypothetical protein
MFQNYFLFLSEIGTLEKQMMGQEVNSSFVFAPFKHFYFPSKTKGERWKIFRVF